MTLRQLRKTLRQIIKHERRGEWELARNLNDGVFQPALILAGVSMQLTADEVRRLL